MQAIPVITIEAAAQLLSALEDFLEKSEANFAMVIDRGGAILSQHGNLPVTTDPATVAALAAGSYAATSELAARVGEAEFNALHQEGRETQILISAVDDDVVLVTAFGPQTTLGLVRFYSARAIAQIADIVRAARAMQQHAPVFSRDDLRQVSAVFPR